MVLDLNFGPKITDGRRPRQINCIPLFQGKCFNQKTQGTGWRNPRPKIQEVNLEEVASNPRWES